MMPSESLTELGIRSERALLESLSSRTWFVEVELEMKSMWRRLRVTIDDELYPVAGGSR
jgi:hypothetical protein